jgi:hypothetical protein
MRRMHRYEINLSAHDVLAFKLTHIPVHFAAKREYGTTGDHIVEFWAIHDDELPEFEHTYQVIGTGNPIPEDCRYVGTCDRLDGLVWHVFEKVPPATM